MAGVDEEFDGEARPQPGIRIGYLPQEPQLDESKTVREVVEEGVGEVRDWLNKFDGISMKFAEPMDDEAMNALLAEQAELQESLRMPMAGSWKEFWKLRLTPSDCRNGKRPSVIFRAVNSAV